VGTHRSNPPCGDVAARGTPLPLHSISNPSDGQVSCAASSIPVRTVRAKPASNAPVLSTEHPTAAPAPARPQHASARSLPCTEPPTACRTSAARRLGVPARSQHGPAHSTGGGGEAPTKPVTRVDPRAVTTAGPRGGAGRGALVSDPERPTATRAGRARPARTGSFTPGPARSPLRSPLRVSRRCSQTRSGDQAGPRPGHFGNRNTHCGGRLSAAAIISAGQGRASRAGLSPGCQAGQGRGPAPGPAAG
jgi:hypothetical protein